MSALSFLRSREAATPVSHDLETVLQDLRRFGKPGLSMLTTGWWCRVDMNTNTTGSSFKVESDQHQSPLAAARECMERINAALKMLGKA